MSELKQKAMSGVRWTTLSAVILATGGMLQTFIFPRLLEAQDFTLMGITNVFLGLATQFGDMGFGNAILRERAPAKKRLSTFYWANIGLGLLFAVLLWMGAPAIASFFPKLDAVKLVNMLHWICPAFILNGLTMQYQTLLQKAFRFKFLAIVESISFALGFLLTLFFAFSGFGALSLVWGTLIKVSVGALSMLILGLRAHRPLFYFSWRDVRDVWKFGALQSVEKIIAYTAVNIDTLLMARIFPPAISGAYEVAKRLLIQPWYVLNPIVTKVMYPVMTQVHNDQPRLRNIALRSIHLVAFLNVPIYVACAVGADMIVPALFGSKWGAAVEPFRWLALAYLIRSVLNPLGSVILAKGKGLLALNFQIGAFLALIVSISLGAAFGLTGMLFSLCLINLLLLAPCYYFIAKPLLGARFSDLGEQVKVELPLAVAVFFTLYALVKSWGDGLLFVALYAIAGAALYLYGVLYFRPRLLEDLKQMLIKQTN
jgi:O-antigen/teichoic acid export membrane protein